jgi:outer membrane protein assembly factor BamB
MPKLGEKRRRGWILVTGAGLLVTGVPSAEALTRSATPLAATAAAGCSVTAGAWPMYQGDPTHTANACSSITPANVTTLHPAWFTALPGAVTSTPAVEGGRVYVGDSTGALYALSQSTGAKQWTFQADAPQSCFVDTPRPHADIHQVGAGKIASSAAVADIAGVPTVFVGEGGSLFAVNAVTGTCRWAQDTDPAHPNSAVEIESSPVVDTSLHPPEVLVGNDDNSSGGVAVTGLVAFDAQTGALLWKYEPERDLTLTPAQFGGSDARTLSCGDGDGDATYCNPAKIADLPPDSATYADGCGDVWSSPALDAHFIDPGGANTFEGSASRPAGWFPKRITPTGRAAADGLAVFGTGNCGADPTPATALAHGDYADNQGIFALDPRTGVRVWSFIEPYNLYDHDPNEPWGGDTDFGSSAVIAPVAASAACPSSLVLEGSKAGYAYGLCEATGRRMWANQVAQPGEADQSLFGAIGGFIGSPALGRTGGRLRAFFTSAIPLPLANEGLRDPGTSDHNITSCPGPVLSSLPLLPACPDLSLLQDPLRAMSLHAVDAATGTVVWAALSLPTYAAATFTNGVVFDPQTLGFGMTAYNATTGLPLWAFPLAASPSSAAAVVANRIFVGAGTAQETIDGQVIPPQVLGVWAFQL